MQLYNKETEAQRNFCSYVNSYSNKNQNYNKAKATEEAKVWGGPILRNKLPARRLLYKLSILI
jgi:hypothetical protein